MPALKDTTDLTVANVVFSSGRLQHPWMSLQYCTLNSYMDAVQGHGIWMGFERKLAVLLWWKWSQKENGIGDGQRKCLAEIAVPFEKCSESVHQFNL